LPSDLFMSAWRGRLEKHCAPVSCADQTSLRSAASSKLTCASSIAE
jgi:hypothetical protein